MKRAVSNKELIKFAENSRRGQNSSERKVEKALGFVSKWEKRTKTEFRAEVWTNPW